jgi:hypothetical protein
MSSVSHPQMVLIDADEDLEKGRCSVLHWKTSFLFGFPESTHAFARFRRLWVRTRGEMSLRFQAIDACKSHEHSRSRYVGIRFATTCHDHGALPSKRLCEWRRLRTLANFERLLYSGSASARSVSPETCRAFVFGKLRLQCHSNPW